MSVRPLVICAVATCCLSLSAFAEEKTAEQKEAPTSVKAAGGALQLSIPSSWKQKAPKSRIIELEFSVPGKEDAAPGRMTMMSAGGSIDANIERWIDQFPTKNGKPKVEELNVGGKKVHYVDIKGTYNDKARPFGPGVLRDNYRMLAAIIPVGDRGQYFIKLYGPAATIDSGSKEFRAMVEGVKRN